MGGEVAALHEVVARDDSPVAVPISNTNRLPFLVRGEVAERSGFVFELAEVFQLL